MIDNAGGPLRIFVAMPGTSMGDGARWTDIAEIKSNLLQPAAERIGAQLGRPAELVIEKDKVSAGAIHRSMFNEAYDADIYIADLTGSNANVYLELGVRWALRDGVTIPISQNLAEVRFNVSATRVIPYGMSPNELRQAVNQIVEAAVLGMSRPDHVDSPVRDGTPTVAVPKATLTELRTQIESLRNERADDLVSAARGAEPARAIDLLRQALARNPHNFDAHFRLGVLLGHVGSYGLAAGSLREAVAIQPANSEAWRELAVALSRDGKLDEAEPAARRAIDLEPLVAKSHAALGGIHRRRARGLPDDAASDALRAALGAYRKAHDLDPNDTYPLINIAQIALVLGELGAGGETARQYLPKLELLTKLSVLNFPDDAWKQLDLTTTQALLGRASDARAEAHRSVELIDKRERASYLSTAAEPLRDALAAGRLDEAQREAIEGVLAVFRATGDAS